jgi:FkbM family methyltransferase
MQLISFKKKSGVDGARANGHPQSIRDILWAVGVRSYRFSRRLPLLPRLHPLLYDFAGRVAPAPKSEAHIRLESGLMMFVPPLYRDTRSLGMGLFQQDETDLLTKLLRPGMTFVDIGGYIGYFTLLGSIAVGRSGRVFAFEPEPSAYGYLVRNVRENRLSNVEAREEAAADRSGTGWLVPDPRGPESFVTQETSAAGAREIQVVRLDDFFGQHGWPRVDVIKMNIEGGEYAALRGMEELSERNADMVLVMEYNRMAFSRAGVSRPELERALRDLGFSMSRVIERGVGRLHRRELLPRHATVCNLLLTKS